MRSTLDINKLPDLNTSDFNGLDQFIKEVKEALQTNADYLRLQDFKITKLEEAFQQHECRLRQVRSEL